MTIPFIRGASLGERGFTVVFAAFAILYAAALSTPRLLPFTDLPNHIASGTIARHIGEGGNEFSKYYRVDLFPKPNVAHLLFCRLPVFKTAEAATRAWYALYALLMPLSAVLLIRRLGGSSWPALLSAIYTVNYSVSWGFVGYTMAVPLVLLSAWASAGLAEKGGDGRSVLSAAMLLAVFLTHAVAAAFAVVLHITFVLLHPGAGRASRAARLAPVLPVAFFASAWWFFGREPWLGPGTAEYLAQYYSGKFFSSFLSRWKMLMIDNYHLYDGAPGELIAAAFALPVVLAAAVPLWMRMRRGETAGSLLAGGGMRLALAFFILSLCCSLLLPRGIPGQQVLAQRFPALAMLSLVVLAGVAWRGFRPRAAPVIAAVLCAVHLALWWSNFAAFNRENEGFAPGLFPESRRGAVLSGIIYDYKWRGRPAYIHFPNYYITWKKGIASTSVIGYRFGAVRRKAPLSELPAYLEWLGRAGGYDGRYGRISYLLVRGTPPAGREWETSGFTETASAGKWRLLENDSIH